MVLYLGFGFGCFPFFFVRQQNHLYTVLITSHNVLKSIIQTSMFLLSHSYLCTLFSCQIIWQEALPQKAHPSLVLGISIHFNDSVYSLSTKHFCDWMYDTSFMYCFMWHHVTHGCTVNCELDSVYIRRVVLGEVLHSYSAVTLLYGDGLLLYTVITCISKKSIDCVPY